MAALLRFLFHPPQTNNHHPPANSGLVDDRDPFLLARQTYYGPFFILQEPPEGAPTNHGTAAHAGSENISAATAQMLWNALGRGHELSESELRSLRGVFTEV